MLLWYFVIASSLQCNDAMIRNNCFEEEVNITLLHEGSIVLLLLDATMGHRPQSKDSLVDVIQAHVSASSSGPVAFSFRDPECRAAMAVSERRRHVFKTRSVLEAVLL